MEDNFFPFDNEQAADEIEVTISDTNFSSAVEHMYKPREAVFGAVAADMVKMGWSIFPQEVTGVRRPGRIGREMIKPSEDHKLATQLPTKEAIELWTRHCPTLNVAVVLGPASGNAFVLDIDVIEEEFSAQIQELAEQILGQTPLRRVGRWPKVALVYRASADDPIPSRSPTFVATDSPENPENVAQQLEIISNGKAMTFYGKHHKTGRYFEWLDGPPTVHSPMSVPLVSSAKLNEFIDAVDSIRQFQRAAAFEGGTVTFEWDETQKIHVPRIRASAGASEWTEDEHGKVVDGRENYLTKIAFRTVISNPSIVLTPDKQVISGGIDRLADTVVKQFLEGAEATGRWRGQNLFNEARSRVARNTEKLRRGEIKAFVPTKDDKGQYVTSSNTRNFIPPQPRKAEGDSLDFLPPHVDPTTPDYKPNMPGSRRPMRCEVLPPEEGAFEDRKISEDRTEIGNAVQKGIQGGYHAFWNDVYDTSRLRTRLHIHKAPTGAGKTSQGIAFIAQDPRTKEDFVIRGTDGEVVHEGRCPILFLLPTYANIEELRSRSQVLNLDGNLNDEELRAQAEDKGLIHEDDLPEKLAELRRDAKNAGLETMLYQGKIRAGCRLKEKMEIAMKAGMGTSRLCTADVSTGVKDENGKLIMETKFCEFYNDCDAIRQKDQIQKSHVVFMPHAFLALNIPDELKHVRAVVADERIHHLFLHTAMLDMDVFSSPRKPPKLTKKEKENKVDEGNFFHDRNKASEIVRHALMTKKCPAEALLDTPDMIFIDGEGPNNKIRVPAAREWIKSALRSCGASMQRDGDISPVIDIEDLKAICAQPTGVQVREEYRLWKIIEERYEARMQERVNEGLAKDQGIPFTRTTKGDHDYRIQYIEEPRETGEVKQQIRLSWRETPNWVDRPMLLLDASAAPEMVAKIWCGKEVVVHDTPAALNVRTVAVADRTYSNSSVVGSPSASRKEQVASAKMLSNVREAISTVSAMYGFSRVVAGGSILLRKAVNTAWEGPHNVDWCHYGAMRGLDFAKHHAAAISVGRMELPVRVIDGLVAALTYDDDEPEAPFDKHGTGLGDNGESLRVPMGLQKVKMRSGHDVNVPAPMYPGKWGRMIQRQYREEELLQFLGRLRPVYRQGDAPIWFNMSSVIPEEVIVDDIINIEDLVNKGTKAWEAMRRCHGILDSRIAAIVCDDMFTSPERVGVFMKQVGLNDKTGEIDRRTAWGIVSYRWIGPDGKPYHSFVRAELENRTETLRNAIEHYLGFTPEILEETSVPKGQTLARGRKSDKIEDELGTLDVRRSVEDQNMLDTAIEILLRTPPEAIAHLKERPKLPISIPTGVANDSERSDADAQINIKEAETQLAIRKLWEKLGYSRSDDFGYDAELLHAETGEETDASYAAVGASHDDVAHEPPILTFDEQDIEIPW